MASLITAALTLGAELDLRRLLEGKWLKSSVSIALVAILIRLKKTTYWKRAMDCSGLPLPFGPVSGNGLADLRQKQNKNKTMCLMSNFSFIRIDFFVERHNSHYLALIKMHFL